MPEISNPPTIYIQHKRAGQLEVLDLTYKNDSDKPEALVVRDSKGRQRQFMLDSSLWVSDVKAVLKQLETRRQVYAEQIKSDKAEGRAWYSQHKSELPAVGYRGAGDDRYSEYLRRAYDKVKDSPLKLKRTSFGGQDDSPESILSTLLHDAGTLEASDPQDRITSTAEYALRQRDDASTENGLTREDVIARLASRFGEAISAYFQHRIDRSKCRDIEITVYGKNGVWTLKPAIVKKWALAVEKWVLVLEMPLSEKARFLAELRQAVEAERREIAWRALPDPAKADKWGELFAAVEPRKLWWERRRPQIPDEREIPDWLEWVLCLAGKRSQRWLLYVGPLLGGSLLPENPLPIDKIKALSGGNTWSDVRRPATSYYLSAFGRASEDGPAYEFIRSAARPRIPAASDLAPLPPIPRASGLEPLPDKFKTLDKPKRTALDAARWEKKQDKLRIIVRGEDRIRETESLPKREQLEIADIVGGLRENTPVRKIAQRLHKSESYVNRVIKRLKEAGK